MSKIKRYYRAVSSSIDSMGNISLGGIALESGDKRLLDLSQLNLDQHVAMQPGAIAFFGTLKKEASRELARLRRNYERWEVVQKQKARASLDAKPTLEAIQARFIADNKAEIEEWDEKIEEAQVQYDVLDNWYEGWRQKGFLIRDYVNLDEDERYNSSSSVSSDVKKDGDFSENREKINTVRDIIERNRSN